MSSLPRNWRLSINNQSGVNVDVTITARRWKFDNTGALVYSTEATVYNQTGIASSTTAWTTGTVQDNSAGADLWLGADLLVTITPASSATLNVALQIEGSTDAGTTWPRQGGGVDIRGFSTSAAVTGAQRFSADIG